MSLDDPDDVADVVGRWSVELLGPDEVLVTIERADDGLRLTRDEALGFADAIRAVAT